MEELDEFKLFKSKEEKRAEREAEFEKCKDRIIHNIAIAKQLIDQKAAKQKESSVKYVQKLLNGYLLVTANDSYTSLYEQSRIGLQKIRDNYYLIDMPIYDERYIDKWGIERGEVVAKVADVMFVTPEALENLESIVDRALGHNSKYFNDSLFDGIDKYHLSFYINSEIEHVISNRSYKVLEWGGSSGILSEDEFEQLIISILGRGSWRALFIKHLVDAGVARTVSSLGPRLFKILTDWINNLTFEKFEKLSSAMYTQSHGRFGRDFSLKSLPNPYNK